MSSFVRVVPAVIGRITHPAHGYTSAIVARELVAKTRSVASAWISKQQREREMFGVGAHDRCVL